MRRKPGWISVAMKWVYYAFGGFIGFVCGTMICLIFLAVERSGNPILSSLPQKFGVFGEYLLELYNALPFFGVAIGIVMVRMMFRKRFENQEDGPETP